MRNLFALEPLLIARLAETLPPEVQVLTAPYFDDLNDLESRARRLPAAIVMALDGVPVGDGKGAVQALRLVQRWSVVLATRERADALSGASGRLLAGELASTVIDALHGWQPAPRTKPLALARVLSPLFREGGWQVLPLLFTHETPRVCGD